MVTADYGDDVDVNDNYFDDEYEPSAVQLEFEQDELDALGDPITHSEFSVEELRHKPNLIDSENPGNDNNFYDTADHQDEDGEGEQVLFEEDELQDLEDRTDWAVDEEQSPPKQDPFVVVDDLALGLGLGLETKYLEMNNNQSESGESNNDHVSPKANPPPHLLSLPSSNTNSIQKPADPKDAVISDREKAFRSSGAISVPLLGGMGGAYDDGFITPTNRNNVADMTAKSVRFSPLQTPTVTTRTSYKQSMADVHDLITPTNKRSMGTPSSTSDVLIEARKECMQLRSLNERLALSLEEAQRFAGDLRLEKERLIIDHRRDQENALQRLEAREREKYDSMEKMYKSQINQLIIDLKAAEKTHEHYNQLRLAQEREKEIELLSLRKELLLEKEKQLEKLAHEFKAEKEKILRNFEHEKSILAADLKRARLENVQSIGIQVEDDSIQDELQKRDSNIMMLENRVRDLQQSYEKILSERSQKISELEEKLLNNSNVIPPPPPPMIQTSQPPDDELVAAKLEALRLDLLHDFEMSQKSFIREKEDLIAGIKAEHEVSLKAVIDRYSREKENALQELRDIHLQDQRKAILQIKEQCSTYYEGALSKVKADFDLERQSLKDQIKTLSERDAASRNSNINLSDHYVSQSRHSEQEIGKMRKYLESMKSSWDEEKQSYLNLIQETKKTMEEDKRICLHRMKMQYLETLKKIRDEIRISKSKTSESMELEWKKRKQELIAKMEAEYDLKLLRMKSKYENHMQELLEMSKVTKQSLSVLPPPVI